MLLSLNMATEIENNKENRAKSANALREEAILEFWKENKIFQKSLDKPARHHDSLGAGGEAPKGNYVFYDGPPFATGRMHYGHILGSTAKDVIGRYQTMKGFHVPRKWGWDCHGLPIEHLVEKELKIAGHHEIEALGIDKFVEYARSKVMQFDREWEVDVERIGRWVDFEGGYKTMDNDFIESVWWALSEFNKKGLVYEGVRVLAYCPRCETPIANSEIAMDNSYKDITDISVYVKFELVDEPGTYLLAWTTTPWTLPGNTAIAINKEIDYIKVKIGDENFILAKETAEKVLKEKEHTVLEEFKGEKLIGKKYKPVFPYYEEYFKSQENTRPTEQSFGRVYKIWHADFVTTDMGTGIAHEAPAFGEDDMNLAKANNIPWIIHVDEMGKFKNEVTDFAGILVKPKSEEKDGHQKTDVEIIKYLAKNGLLFAKEKIVHSYPHCYRCETPLYYYALPSWFINIQKEKEKIIKNIESMNWVPEHLKNGRFKNIVEGAPDWNISRNRYWASPMPIWKNKEGKAIFVSSFEELKSKTKKSGNKYFVMRHGESSHNLDWRISTKADNKDHLTDKGKEEVRKSAEDLKDKNIDMIVMSPFIRTEETAEIVREVLGLQKENTIVDDRLAEFRVSSFEGKTWKDYHDVAAKIPENFDWKVEGDESYLDVKKRMMDTIYEYETKYKNKNILFITHGGPAWLLTAGVQGYSIKDTYSMISSENNAHLDDMKNADYRELAFVPLPHNAKYEIDFHRPYIDDIVLVDETGEEYKRIPEVLDCWFESGSMPFAQDHFPFDNPDWQKNNFPAGFVAEYIAQTRTWFYYSHVISTILFGSTPFKNIVTTGTLRAEDGQKMSKSKNNFPDPKILFDKYGVDALRIYLMASPLMKGEDANFSEKLVQEIASKIIGRLMNVLAFYELYRDKEIEGDTFPNSKNVLDLWILSRLDQTIDDVTSGMEAYDMAEAVRPIEGLIDDLSTWYLRRSRERMKENDTDAKQTLYFVLINIAKTIAPFAPFTAEEIWMRLKREVYKESIHLEEWPTYKGFDFEVLDGMQNTRDIVSLGLQLRQKNNIPVRQPLSELKVKSLKLSSEYIELIKDELNVKEVVQDESLTSEVALDLEITPKLKQEGYYRELVRAVQDMRKDMGLVPSDVISLHIKTDNAGEDIINRFKNEILKTVGAKEIKFDDIDGNEVKIDDLVFKLKIQK